MKILAVSDEESEALWDYYVPGRLDGFDLILSCGDLKASYLSFLVTMAKCPLMYVAGNHDESYVSKPPDGCDCIDDKFVVYNGIRILGLGGCLWYHPGPYQYTEWQMRRRIRRLRGVLRKHRGVDIVVTHAPPKDLGDGQDPAHKGFQALRDLLDQYHPQYLLHGHVHPRYEIDPVIRRDYNGTTLINVCPRYTLEIPDREVPQKERNEILWKNGKPRYPEFWEGF